jgi:hypothetical protein
MKNKDHEYGWKALLLMGLLYISLLYIGVLAMSCARAVLLYPTGTGTVQIYPDTTVYILPRLEYRFYGSDTVLIRTSDGRGNFEGDLPAGLYRMLAVNTGDSIAAGVTFNMDNYETAAVTVKNAQPNEAGGATGLSMVNSGLYSVLVRDLEVKEFEHIRREPAPVLLTKRLVLVFTFSGGLEREVTSLAGVLPGVYSSVYLSDSRPTPQSLTQSLTAATRFELHSQGAERSVQIGLLGLRNPKDEPVYTCNLALTLTLNNGSREETAADLTDEISDAIATNGGVLPPQVIIPITLSLNEIGITVEVKPWNDGKGQTIPI